MVREARFAWDGDNPYHDFSRPDRFEDLDDGFDDPLIPDESRKPSRRLSRTEPHEARTPADSHAQRPGEAGGASPKRARAKD